MMMMMMTKTVRRGSRGATRGAGKEKSAWLVFSSAWNSMHLSNNSHIGFVIIVLVFSYLPLAARGETGFGLVVRSTIICVEERYGNGKEDRSEAT